MNISNVSQWWLKKRLHYNKALLFTGLMGFTVQAVQQPFTTNAKLISDGLMSEMRLSGTFFILFLILANIAFSAGSIIDLLFNYKNSQSFKERLFLIGYWFSISLLTFFIMVFLYLILPGH